MSCASSLQEMGFEVGADADLCEQAAEIRQQAMLKLREALVKGSACAPVAVDGTRWDYARYLQSLQQTILWTYQLCASAEGPTEVITYPYDNVTCPTPPWLT